MLLRVYLMLWQSFRLLPAPDYFFFRMSKGLVENKSGLSLIINIGKSCLVIFVPQKKHIKGQALAMRGIQYFHLIQNYQ
ncbi:hypothetical protein DWW91_04920 [Parabacteroides sp. AF17-3]|nr:hypothetical protein DWW91_04920 [Parabacteroides sp. AF17-3]